MAVFFLLLLYNFIVASSIKLLIYPSNKVILGNEELITWSSMEPLDITTIDLHKNKLLIENIGSTKKNIYSYRWTVSNNIPTGDNYFIRLIGISETNITSITNSPTFSIRAMSNTEWTKIAIISIVGVLILTLCWRCLRAKQSKSILEKEKGLFVPFAATDPPPLESICE